jgi:hypothetical protein
VGKKRFDPLWEIVDEKVALKGHETCIDAVCPHCRVNVDVPPEAVAGERVLCGLCGKVSQVIEGARGPALAALAGDDQ